jgi:hypothetical protein
MATLKEDSDSWSATSIIRRDHQHDKGEGYEETPHKKVHKKETPRKKPGCKGNDSNAHIYVWIGARFVPKSYPIGGVSYVDQVSSKWAYRDHPEYDSVFYGWQPFDSQAQHIAWLEAREIQVCAGCYKATGKRRMKDTEEPDNSWWY